METSGIRLSRLEMMAKDNFNCDVQNTEERPALQRIGFAKLHMMIHEHAPTALTPAKEDEKNGFGPNSQRTGNEPFACQAMLP